MDQVYQAMYGPNEDKLKHSGAAWLAISLLANVAGSNLTGFIGLLAILAVVTKSDYLLFLVRPEPAQMYTNRIAQSRLSPAKYLNSWASRTSMLLKI